MGYRTHLLFTEVVVAIGTAIYGWWLLLDSVQATNAPTIIALSELMPVDYWAITFIWVGGGQLILLLLSRPQVIQRNLLLRRACSAIIAILWLFVALDTLRYFSPATPVYAIVSIQSMTAYAWLCALSKNNGTT